MTASLPVRPAAADFDHPSSPRVKFQELIQVWRLDDRSLAVVCPPLWNDLPFHLRESELTLLEFRRLLKMHLF